mmetsp:Transcript_40207/g.51782  ORF Transcript_40207/g.51782 Transcript_40207/m.51782 type:complete len:264 (+) Transcript_40207:329-1120(+)
MTHQDFMDKENKRKRYWARSLIGWKDMKKAEPNRAHKALSLLEKEGIITYIITQNVDGLHQRAGSKNVLNLHGSINHVRCLVCNHIHDRKDIQKILLNKNQNFTNQIDKKENEFLENKDQRPDGDANLSESIDFDSFQLPYCGKCLSSSSSPSSSPSSSTLDLTGGFLKPDVVFFGDTVPKSTVSIASEAVEESDGLLVVGSSLEVYSAYRLLLKTHQLNKPICILNLGETRPERSNIYPITKIHLPCDEALWDIVQHMGLVE